jgi:hypothetical protein
VRSSATLPDRAAVVDAYFERYVPAASVASGWNGNVAGCLAGHLAVTYVDATLDRINFARWLAGLPDTVTAFGGLRQESAQAAALMMSAQNALSHDPPTSWACYSSIGASGAMSSNLSIGFSGVSALDAYLDESGAGNHGAGHRRWILFPPQSQVGVGFVAAGAGHPASQALWVLGPFGPRPATPDGVAWPAPGFIPFQVMPRFSNRWSFSYPDADFSAARVRMHQRCRLLSEPALEPLVNGFGDNALVWKPAGVSYATPSLDTPYRVAISGVRGPGIPGEFHYRVTVIDPDAAASPPPHCSGFEAGE